MDAYYGRFNISDRHINQKSEERRAHFFNTINMAPQAPRPHKRQRLDSDLVKLADKGNLTAVQRDLLRAGADVNAINDIDDTALRIASAKGDIAMVRELLARKDVNVNVRDKHASTPLMWASLHGHNGVVRLLLEHKDVDVNARGKNYFSRTSLMMAGHNGDYHTVRELLAHKKLDLNAVDTRGNSTLMVVIRGMFTVERRNVVRELVQDERMDVNVKDHYGRTALMWAISMGNLDYVRFFLRNNAIDIVVERTSQL